MPEWLEVLLGDVSLLQAVFWLIAVGALIAAIVRLWPVLRRFMTIVDAVAGLPAFITRTDRRIGEIHHEVHFNNGSSVKDSVLRTEHALGVVAATSARLEEGVAGLYVKVDELAAVDDELWSEIESTHPKEP